MVRGRAGEQQVPHRAFGRFGMTGLFIGSTFIAFDLHFCFFDFYYPKTFVIPMRAESALEEPAVVCSGNGPWSRRRTAGSSAGFQPDSE
jgi:hypothetical protein